jgi:hypothetical protein
MRGRGIADPDPSSRTGILLDPPGHLNGRRRERSGSAARITGCAPPRARTRRRATPPWGRPRGPTEGNEAEMGDTAPDRRAPTIKVQQRREECSDPAPPPAGGARSHSLCGEGTRPASTPLYAEPGASASAERHIFRASNGKSGCPEGCPGPCFSPSGWGYRLSAQRRHGTTSRRSTSSPTSSSKTV